MPSAAIEVSGHTDNVGGDKKNKRLSQQRADAVRDYAKGIASIARQLPDPLPPASKVRSLLG